MTNEGYEKLMVAIVKQAYTDLKLSRRAVEKYKQKEKTKKLTREQEKNKRLAERRIIDCMNFFKSEWFESLTNVDGDFLINAIYEKEKKDDYL